MTTPSPSRLQGLPDPLRTALRALPPFYVLEYFGRNPGALEDTRGLAHRIGLSMAEAEGVIGGLVALGLLEQEAGPGEALYRLARDPQLRGWVIAFADGVNRTRGEFLAYVREILRLPVDQPHA